MAVRPGALDFEQRSGGMKLTCSMREHLRSYPVGGIVLFATNISSQSQMTGTDPGFSAFRREQPSGRGG